ncbi:hypothetical protein CEXT_326491 [Caerostris extrusa]|uniref:Uncharacterized protein n=1 Tax=Caerostris extrusa TaxID=172846 RepID=A0AAV4NGV0_CAEEX|nr:hypothetical protein CEXT_326491 [Caerostris extrusa]
MCPAAFTYLYIPAHKVAAESSPSPGKAVAKRYHNVTESLPCCKSRTKVLVTEIHTPIFTRATIGIRPEKLCSGRHGSSKLREGKKANNVANGSKYFTTKPQQSARPTGYLEIKTDEFEQNGCGMQMIKTDAFEPNACDMQLVDVT